MTLEELARLVDGRARGAADVTVRDVAPLDDAGPDDLGLLADRRYLDRVPESRAGALLVSTELEDALPEGCAYVAVKDARAALVAVLERFHPEPEPREGIHPTAILGRGVAVGSGVRVDAYAVIEKGATLADRCRIGPHAVVGEGSRVGESSVLHAHATLYPGTVLGRHVVVHSGARLGVDGFGYAMVDGTFRKIPQVGRCVVADDVEIGANTCIDRGSIGETRVGPGSKLDNLVQLGHNVRVGRDCAMAGQVGVAGSTRIGDRVVVGGQAGLAGHVEIGDGAQISAQAGVIGDVEAGGTVTGYPARDLRTYLRATAHFLRLPELARRLGRLEARIEELMDR